MKKIKLLILSSKKCFFNSDFIKNKQIKCNKNTLKQVELVIIVD